MTPFVRIFIFLILVEITHTFLHGSITLNGSIEEDVGHYIAFEGEQAVINCEYTWRKINISVTKFSASYNEATSNLLTDYDTNTSFPGIIRRNFTLNITKSLSGNISCFLSTQINDSTVENRNVTFKAKTILFLKVLNRSEFNGCRSNLGSEIIEGENVTQCCSTGLDKCTHIGNIRNERDNNGTICQTYNVTTLNQIIDACPVNQRKSYLPFSPLKIHKQLSLEINPQEVFLDFEVYHSETSFKNISFSCASNPPSKSITWQVFAYAFPKNRYVNIFWGRSSSTQAQARAKFHLVNQPGLSTLDIIILNWRYKDNRSEYKFKPMYVSCQADINSRGPLKRFAYFNYRRNLGEESHGHESDDISNSTAGNVESPEQSTHSALYLYLIVALATLSLMLLFSCMYLLLGKLGGVQNTTKGLGPNESILRYERQSGDGGDSSSGLVLSVRNVSVRNADRIVTGASAEHSAIVKTESQLRDNDGDKDGASVTDISVHNDGENTRASGILNHSLSQSTNLANRNESVKSTELNLGVGSDKVALESGSFLDNVETEHHRPDNGAVMVLNTVYESSDQNIEKDIRASSNLDQSNLQLKESHHIIQLANRTDSVRGAELEGVVSGDSAMQSAVLDNAGVEHERTDYETVMVRNEAYELCNINAPMSSDA